MSTEALNSRGGEDDKSQLLVDQITVLLNKEGAFYFRVDYLGELPESYNFIDREWRQKAAAWMIKVVNGYNLDRGIVSKCWLDDSLHPHMFY
jgi:hypothetical protein